MAGTILGAGNATTNSSRLWSSPAQSLKGDKEKQTGHDHRVEGPLQAQGSGTLQEAASFSLRSQTGFPRDSQGEQVLK